LLYEVLLFAAYAILRTVNCLTGQTNNHNKEQAQKRIRKKTPKTTKENSTGTKHK
jgi:hypothetical protein